MQKILFASFMPYLLFMPIYEVKSQDAILKRLDFKNYLTGLRFEFESASFSVRLCRKKTFPFILTKMVDRREQSNCQHQQHKV